jgi:hypothetical protein
VTTPVWTFVTVTATSATNAPAGSVTPPLISPVFAFWAKTKLVAKLRKNATIRRSRLPALVNLIAETSGSNFRKEPAPSVLARTRSFYESGNRKTLPPVANAMPAWIAANQPKVGKRKIIFLDNAQQPVGSGEVAAG